MDESTMSVLRLLFFVVTLYIVIKSFFPNRGLKNKKLYFEFCQIRRDLLLLVMEDKINPKSLSFNFFMRYVSDVIHYSDDYDIATGAFFQSIKADSKELGEQKFVDKLFADVKKQDGEFQKLFVRIMTATVRLFESNTIVLFFVSFKVLQGILTSRKPTSRYTYAVKAAQTVKATCACAA